MKSYRYLLYDGLNGDKYAASVDMRKEPGKSLSQWGKYAASVDMRKEPGDGEG